jgi:hypothetical protein
MRDDHVPGPERDRFRDILVAEVLQAREEGEQEAPKEEDDGCAHHGAERVLALQHCPQPGFGPRNVALGFERPGAWFYFVLVVVAVPGTAQAAGVLAR